jgi:hypothetical protein
MKQSPVSNRNMGRRILRLFGWFLSAVALLTALLTIAIRVDQYLLRWRAERLQSDIRSLELRKSTYADVRRLEARWLDDTKEKVCRPSWCDLQISLNNTSSRYLQFLLNHLTLRAVYHGLGGRVAGTYAFIHVRDNLLWEKGISLGIETLSTRPDGSRVEYWLAGSVGTDDHFTWVSTRHPEYQIGSPNACTSCREGWVNFTPFADPKDVSRLTDLNFTCFTRWRHCTEQADILPAPWKEMREEALEERQNGSDLCSLDTIRVLSRQSRRIDLVKVTKLKPLNEWNLLMTVHRLPGSVPERADIWQELSIPQWQDLDIVVDTSEGFHVGDRLLYVEEARRLVAATQQNLDAARLGAGEGWINPAHPVKWPYSFTPRKPKIDVR